MGVSKLLATMAAASLAVSPALAAPVNPAASLSVAKSVRSGSTSAKANELAGGGAFVAIAAAIAVIVGIVIVAKSNDNPTSP